MKKSYPVILFLLLTLVFLSCKEKTIQEVKPLEVPVTKVVQQDVAIESEYTGQTYGESDVEIATRVEGWVQSINFKEGSVVSKGSLLYTIDPLPYQNKVDQASGIVAEANTMLVKAKSDLDRIEPLAKINAVSQRELVSAQAQYEAAKAEVQSAEAALRNAKIELGYCRMVAPISGIIGISKVRVGDYINRMQFNSINTISQTDNIRVRFTISEQEFMRINREIKSENSSLRGAGKNIVLILSDGSKYPTVGQLSFADRQIDPATGAMTLEANFANPDKILRPGQYVKVRVVTDVRKEALLIPQRSVIEMQGIFQVFVLGDSNKVSLKIIQTGPVYKDAYVVVSGLSANEKIAFGGTQLLKNGSPITPIISEWQPGLPVTKPVPTK